MTLRQPADLPTVLGRLLRIGVYIVPFLPLYVSPSLLFPYVTGRNFAFRILIEILLVPYAVLCYVSKRHRPTWSPLTIALVVFVAAVAVADVLGVDPSRSFWSTYQRMEGLLGLIHLALFFLILSAALTSIQDWKRYFALSIGVSALVAVLALFEFALLRGRAQSTLGNPGNLAGYLMLQVPLALLVLQNQRILMVRLLVLAVCLDVMAIFASASRSAMLALVVAAFVMTAHAYFTRTISLVAVRRLALAWILFATTALAWLVLRNRVNIAHLLNSGDDGGEPSHRLLAWRVALRAAWERVWTGWGQEGFFAAWDRYYVPAGGVYDRAHNVFLDWLVSGGVLGFSAWMAFGLALVYRIHVISRTDRVAANALGGILASYLLFGVFWFDTFEMWLLVIGTAAFANAFSYAADTESVPTTPGAARRALTFAVPAATIAAVAVYVLNVRPLLLAREVVSGMSAWARERDLAESRDHFERALAYSGLRKHEAVEQMALLVPEIVALRGTTAPDEVRSFVDRVIRELTTLTDAHPAELKHIRLLGTTYGSASIMNPAWRQRAVESFTRALRMSPNDEQTYFAFASFHAGEGDFDDAIALQRKGIELVPYSPFEQDELVRLALRGGIPADDIIAAMKRRLPTYSIAELREMAIGYVRSGDLQLAVWVLEEMMRRDPGNEQLREQYRVIRARLDEAR